MATRKAPARKSAILSVLDVGASKIVCLIARLTPMEPSTNSGGRLGTGGVKKASREGSCRSQVRDIVWPRSSCGGQVFCRRCRWQRHRSPFRFEQR